jgi:hypothetical protein
VCTTSCTNGVCATPCTGICSNPINFNINAGGGCTFGGVVQSGCGSPNLGTSAICYQTTSTLTGGGCNNFTGGRTLSLNGTAEVCDGGWTSPLPAKVNGGYCINVGAGNYSYAAFNVW